MIKKRSESSKTLLYKPSVAFSNQLAAIENIEAKAAFVSGFCAERSAYLRLMESDADAYLRTKHLLPRSKRSFNSLSSDNLPPSIKAIAPKFGSNSADTLRKSQRHTKQIELLLDMVAKFTDPEVAPPAKDAKIAELKRRAAIATQLREIAEQSVYSLKREVQDLRKQLKLRENMFFALEREAESEISRLKDIINSHEICHLPSSTTVLQMKKSGGRDEK